MWPYMEYWVELVSELFEGSFCSPHCLAIEAMQGSKEGLRTNIDNGYFGGHVCELGGKCAWV